MNKKQYKKLIRLQAAEIMNLSERVEYFKNLSHERYEELIGELVEQLSGVPGANRVLLEVIRSINKAP